MYLGMEMIKSADEREGAGQQPQVQNRTPLNE